MILFLGLGVLLLGSGTFASHLHHDSRLAGGANATMHAPFVVRIEPSGPEGDVRWFCNGALINTTLILTSASCMNGALFAKVMAGSPDFSADETYEGSQWSNSTQIYYHPDFEKNTWANDIAVIRVYPPFNTTTTVNTIRLAKGSSVKGDALANKTALWLSYGMFNATSNATGLTAVPIKAIKTKACEGIYKPGPLFIAVPKSVQCMEPSTTVGMCMGDSGSPVVWLDTKEKDVTKQLGLTALAIRSVTETCPPNSTLTKNAPLMFTRIEPFYKWINGMGGPKA